LINERSGSEVLNRWHDPAGYWTLAACVVAVALTGWLLRRGPRQDRTPSPDPMPRGTRLDWRSRMAALSRPAWIAMELVLAVWGGTEGWFRGQEAWVSRIAIWNFRQPTDAAHFESVEQSRNVRGELRYDDHSGGRWRDAEGRRWVAHYFRWDPGRNA